MASPTLCLPAARRGRPWPHLASAAFALALLVALVSVAAASNPLRVFVVLLASPLVEEVVFRAGLQDALMRHGLRAWAANGWTALAFAAAHVALRPGDPFALAVILPALAIGALYAHQRSVRLCVAVHVVMNIAWLQFGVG